MPSIKEYLLASYVSTVAGRKHADVEPPTTPGQRASDIMALVGIIEERSKLIERLKLTDERRARLHARMKDRWRMKQVEASRLRRRLRVFRHLLRQRRAEIRALSQRLRRIERVWTTIYQSPGMFPVSEAPVPLVAGWRELLVESLLGWVPVLRTWIWRGWMRLGVLRQYEARPLRPDAIPARTGCRAPKWPRITLVTPSFNQVRFLEDTMRSVLDQDYPDLEYIVMDGGSTDGSQDIIRRLEGRLARWQSAPDDGQAAAVRTGLEGATGEIMGWLNSDDLLMPGTLALVGDYFARHPNVDVVYGHRIIVNDRGHEVGRWVLPRHDDDLLLWADFIPQETCFWRRRIYERVGGIDGSFRFALDWDLLLRFQKAGARMKRLPWFLGAFRVHEEQKNAVMITTAGYQEMKYLRRRELGHEFNRGGLARRVNRAQFKALLLTWMMRFGIRL